MVGTNHRSCLSTLPGDLSVCEDIFFKHDSTITVQDGVMKPYRCVVEVKMKAEFEDGCGLTCDYRKLM